MNRALPERTPLPLVLAAILIAAAACRREQEPEKVPEPAGASLRIGEPRHDFGTVLQGAELKHSFVVENTGSEPFDLESVEPGFQCQGRITRSRLAPGQKGSVDVTCRPELYGPFSAKLVVRSNARRSAEAKLELVASVTPLLAFDRDSIGLKMPFGESRSDEVRLTGVRATDARLSLNKPALEGVESVVLAAESGKPQGLRVVCPGKPAGTRVGQVVALTGLEHPAEISVSVSCRVSGTLEVTPTNPYINLREPGLKMTTLTVRSSQPGFTVREVHVTEGPFSAAWEPSGTASEFRVKVIADQARLTESTRGVTGKLVIVSNDRTEPNKELTVFGFGKVRRAGK